jgi:hypothetical protein
MIAAPSRTRRDDAAHRDRGPDLGAGAASAHEGWARESGTPAATGPRHPGPMASLLQQRGARRPLLAARISGVAVAARRKQCAHAGLFDDAVHGADATMARRSGGCRCALFAWLISHQPTVLFSQNKPATNNQPEPASSTLLSEQTSTSHQPPANRTGRK